MPNDFMQRLFLESEGVIPNMLYLILTQILTWKGSFLNDNLPLGRSYLYSADYQFPKDILYIPYTYSYVTYKDYSYSTFNKVINQ